MIAYKYSIENTTYTTFNFNDIPKDLHYITIEVDDNLEFYLTEDIKQKQKEELSFTDWYVIRFIETGKEIPIEILKLRNEIRNS